MKSSPKKSSSSRTKQEAGDRLATYRKKRDFGVTPEPAPEARKPSAKGKRAAAALEFVIQKHDATRLHYDVRIEIAGAMMSWAVPKGPSYDPAVKRLAVETEDHPMAYNRFEGRIPDGEYGGGDVLIWDHGTYETVPPGQEERMRAKGHIQALFHGEKLVGEWHFIRTGGQAEAKAGSKSQWLMFKAKDEHADPKLDVVASRPESVVSGKSATRGPRRKADSKEGHDPKSLLTAVGGAMRAVAATGVEDEAAFLYEVKFDGYRLLGAVAGGEVELVTRKGNDWTERFQAVADALAKLPVREAVVDGEACIVDEQGLSSFQMLQGWLGGEKVAGTLVFAAFDLLWLDGRDLRGQPIEERKELLAALLAKAKAPLVLSPALDGEPKETIAHARRQGLEGLIAKRRGSTYSASGHGAWWKLKFRKEQEVALAGYVPRVDANDEVGALLIAVAKEDGGFEFAGKVGTGFNKKTRKKLAQLLDADASDAPTVDGHPRIKGVRWSKVKRVAQIALAEWTKDGSARAPSFLGLREDKSPRDCVREREHPRAETAARVPLKRTPRASRRTDQEATARPVLVARASKRKAAAKPSAVAREVSPTAPPLTNPTKVLFPRDGITKRDIANYYAAVADVMLPHLAGRPIGLQRWPNGIDEEAWFQQNAPPNAPPFVRLVDTGPKHGSKRKIIAENPATLAWLANLAALTIHQWASHVPADATAPKDVVRALGEADYTVLDLDPGKGTWEHVIQVAETLRGLLEQLELTSVVKTSGQRGLHIVIPFVRGPSHEEATEFGRKLATTVANALPKIATVERMKAKRGGRLYIDFLQNGEGKTIVAPYSIRPKDGAPVSAPVRWSEVTKKLDPRGFTIRNLPDRLGKVGDLFAPLLTPTQKLPHVE